MPEAKSVRDVVLEGVHERQALLERYDAISAEFADPDLTEDRMNELIDEQATVGEEIEDKRCWDLNARIDVAMDALRCPSPERNVQELSGGEKRRVALCRLLLSEPDILLLDEPTNHLDASSVAWLERFLGEYRGLVIAITHDRYFLDNVAGYILEITQGRCIPFKGNYGDWLESKAARTDLESKQNKAKDKVPLPSSVDLPLPILSTHTAMPSSCRWQVIKRELEWLRGTTKAGRGKNTARKNRASSMMAEKAERKMNQRIESGALVVPEGTPLRAVSAIKVDNLSAVVDGRTLFENLKFSIGVGDVLGIVGPNGAGKTTVNTLSPLVTLITRRQNHRQPSCHSHRLPFPPQHRHQCSSILVPAAAPANTLTHVLS